MADLPPDAQWTVTNDANGDTIELEVAASKDSIATFYVDS